MAKQVNARALSDANSGFIIGRLIAYEQLMKNKPDRVERKVTRCEDCVYFHPDWEYRMCLHTKCVYGKDIDVFAAAKNLDLII